MTEAEATTLGTQCGIADAEAVFLQQGFDSLTATLAPCFRWDEVACWTGAHVLCGVPGALGDAYYMAYAQAARARARELAETHGGA